MRRVVCPYCGDDAEQVTGAEVYPDRPDLADRRLYQCKPCGARVGCHVKSGAPFGVMANAELRAARQRVHDTFDPLWRGRLLRRNHAYEMLAKRLGIKRRECHVGKFDLEQCRAAVEVSLEMTRDLLPRSDRPTI